MRKKRDFYFESDIGNVKITNPSEITLSIDDYNDIFSDFDPRHYSQRALSEDFLAEARRASRDKEEEGIQLVFLIPEKRRNLADEEIIKRRLSDHFKKHSDRILNHVKYPILRRGWTFVFFGVVLMFIATLIMTKNTTQNLWKNFLIITLEPGGWFFFWDGLEQIIFEANKINPDIEFYKKMAVCRISFHPLRFLK